MTAIGAPAWVSRARPKPDTAAGSTVCSPSIPNRNSTRVCPMRGRPSRHSDSRGTWHPTGITSCWPASCWKTSSRTFSFSRRDSSRGVISSAGRTTWISAQASSSASGSIITVRAAGRPTPGTRTGATPAPSPATTAVSTGSTCRSAAGWTTTAGSEASSRARRRSATILAATGN